MPLSRSERILLTIGLIVCIFSLFIPEIHGDEALSLFIGHEWKGALNPIVPYLGFAETAVVGFIVHTWQWLTGGQFQMTAPPIAVVRALYWLFYLFAVSRLDRFMVRSKASYRWSLTSLLLFLPTFIAHSQMAWGPALSASLGVLALVELLETGRDKNRAVRYGYWAILLGVAIHWYLMAAVGIVIAFFAIPLRRHRLRYPLVLRELPLILLGVLIAWPVLQNFPPPVSSPYERSGSVLKEILHWASSFVGYQSIQFKWGVTGAIWIFAPLMIGLWLLPLIHRFFIKRSSLPNTSARGELIELGVSKYFGWILFAVTSVVFVYGLRGRSLTMIGHERYILGLIPAWIFYGVISWRDELRTELGQRWSSLLVVTSLCWVLVTYTLVGLKGRVWRDGAHWIVEQCPERDCIVEVPDFWAYWPLRTALGYRYPINSVGANWYPVVKFLPIRTLRFKCGYIPVELISTLNLPHTHLIPPMNSAYRPLLCQKFD